MNRKLKAKIVEMYGTQADFAQALGVDFTYISMIVRDRRQLNDETKRRWANMLECKPEDIFLPSIST